MFNYLVQFFYSQMQMHTRNQKDDVSLDKEFKQNLTEKHHKNGIIDKGTYKKVLTERK